MRLKRRKFGKFMLVTTAAIATGGLTANLKADAQVSQLGEALDQAETKLNAETESQFSASTTSEPYTLEFRQSNGRLLYSQTLNVDTSAQPDYAEPTATDQQQYPSTRPILPQNGSDIGRKLLLAFAEVGLLSKLQEVFRDQKISPQNPVRITVIGPRGSIVSQLECPCRSRNRQRCCQIGVFT